MAWPPYIEDFRKLVFNVKTAHVDEIEGFVAQLYAAAGLKNEGPASVEALTRRFFGPRCIRTEPRFARFGAMASTGDRTIRLPPGGDQVKVRSEVAWGLSVLLVSEPPPSTRRFQDLYERMADALLLPAALLTPELVRAEPSTVAKRIGVPLERAVRRLADFPKPVLAKPARKTRRARKAA